MQVVDEFMSDRAHVVAHAHASATNPEGPKPTSPSDAFTADHKPRMSSSKSPEPKRKEEVFFERCINQMEQSSTCLIDFLKASDDMKMSLLISMQQTMLKLVEKL
jgi:hypothetical protein